MNSISRWRLALMACIILIMLAIVFGGINCTKADAGTTPLISNLDMYESLSTVQPYYGYTIEVEVECSSCIILHNQPFVDHVIVYTEGECSSCIILHNQPVTELEIIFLTP